MEGDVEQKVIFNIPILERESKIKLKVRLRTKITLCVNVWI